MVLEMLLADMPEQGYKWNERTTPRQARTANSAPGPRDMGVTPAPGA